jgi:gamma-glutamyltranspeptidase/glutathione hydrolase
MPDAEFAFRSRRSPALARRGMVATSQPLAVQAGIEMLAQGGTAGDAAVAAAAALAVTEPTSTGVGGDCFALYYDAHTGAISALNGSGRAPAELTLELLRGQGFAEELPPFHAHTVTVPGCVAGLADLHARHGRLDRTQVLAPAIRLAEEGFPVAPVTAHFWDRAVERQLSPAPGGEELTLNGRAPRPGEVFRNPGLARTLRAVADGGADAFYRGEIAGAIARAVRQAGGVMTEADLAAHHSTWETPISTTYRGWNVWEAPPNGQGLVALIALNILGGFDLGSLDPMGPERGHLVLEALRLAFADARWHVADPDFQPAPLEGLLSKEYAAERRRQIRADRASPEAAPGLVYAGSDTVYLTAVDGAGNACSFISSNYMGFGTGIVPRGWGFTLQNRGHGFSLDPAHPNALEPGKRPYHTIIPAMATRADGSLAASFGVMGGFMQPQGHVQVLLAMLEDGLDPQAALDRPRLCLAEGRPDSPVAVEGGFPEATVAELHARGHDATVVTGWGRAVFGRGQIILRDEGGVLWGGSDPRADGCALGL